MRASILSKIAGVGLAWVLSGGMIAAQTAADAEKTAVSVDDSSPIIAVSAQTAVGRAVLAQELRAVALEHNDPVLMLAAVRLAASSRFTARQHERQGDGDASVFSEAPPSAQRMLAHARELAGDDDFWLSLADEVAEDLARAQSRAAGLSAGEAEGHLDVGGLQIWRLPFFGTDLAELAVVGAGEGLALSLFAEHAGETTPVSGCLQRGPALYHCQFRPQENGFYRLEVKNLSAQPQRYRLLTN